MNSVKCSHCGLPNFPTAVECKRCGNATYRPSGPRTKGRPPLRHGFVSLLIFVAIGAAAYYIYNGVRSSISEVSENEAYRVATRSDNQQGVTRAEADRQKSQRVANAVGASAGLAEHNKRTQETQKTMEQLTNSQQR